MKNLFFSLLLGVSAFVPYCTAGAEEPAGSGKIRVLVIVGGHKIDKEFKEFYAIFNAMPDVRYTKAELPQDGDLLKPGLEKQYDVIVMYDLIRRPAAPDITPRQQKAFVDLLNVGIGVVSLHCNLGSHNDWDEFGKIIGGKYFLKPSTFEGRNVPQSKYSLYEDVNVIMADKEHPITRGLKDFRIHDETYKDFYTYPDVRVLMKTDHPKADPEMAWVKQYGKSRVFYFMPGHDHFAHKDPNYHRVVARGVRWAAGRPVEVDSEK